MLACQIGPPKINNSCFLQKSFFRRLTLFLLGDEKYMPIKASINAANFVGVRGSPGYKSNATVKKHLNTLRTIVNFTNRECGLKDINSF